MQVNHDDNGVVIIFGPTEICIGVVALQLIACALDDLHDYDEAEQVRQIAQRIERTEALIGHS